jgi:hypothetical protein
MNFQIDGKVPIHEAAGLQSRDFEPRTMAAESKKPLMRSLGEFFGHIIRGIRTDPSRKTIRKTVEQEQRGDVVLRRTTIEEIELKRTQK